MLRKKIEDNFPQQMIYQEGILFNDYQRPFTLTTSKYPDLDMAEAKVSKCYHKLLLSHDFD